VRDLRNGAVAQLGERGLCKPEVVGSIPSSSTRSRVNIGTSRRIAAPSRLEKASIGCARPKQAGDDLLIQRSLITEYLSELRASCLQDKSR
jgi:hypothetical protein